MIRLRNLRSLDGPNIWSPHPVTTASIVTGDAWHIEQLEQVATMAARLLPELSAPHARTAPIAALPLPAGEGIASLIAALAINLQRLEGIPVEFWSARHDPSSGESQIAFQHHYPALGTFAARLAASFVNGCASEGDPSEAIAPEFRRLSVLAHSLRPGVPSASIIAAARNRDIPVAQDELRGVIELGNGAWRQRISGAVTSRTSLLGERITRDKVWTNRLLREAGLPVPAGMTVRTLEQALHAATAIGYPVVAKPPDQGASTGAYPDLRNETELIASFPRSLAASPSGKVLIEQHLTGRKYRAIVVDSRIVSVLHHIPAHVVGDGARSIRELIEATNADPRRGTRVGSPLAPISIDATLLRMIARELLSLDDVPAQGRFIQLKPIPRWGDGGTCIECTGQVHPHNAAIILQALAVVGLDVTALELITPDISKSIWESSGAIIDINTGITFRSELMPTEGHPRDPGPAVVDMLFPPGQPVRAPIIAVTGAGNRAAICRAIAQELSETGHAVGLATTDAVTINGTELKGVDASGLAGARTVLRNPAVEIAVIEVAPESILQDGLGFDYCDLAVVTSLSGLRTPFDQPVESVLASLLDSAGVVLVDVDIPAVSTLDISSSIPLIPLRLDPTTPTFRESISAVIPTRPNSL